MATITKSEGEAGQFPASDYAYVPDPRKVSTWKLRLAATPGGRPDAAIVGAACAALGHGFRGQKVQIPARDLPAVKATVRAAWKKANPDKKADEMPRAIAESLESGLEPVDAVRPPEGGTPTGPPKGGTPTRPPEGGTPTGPPEGGTPTGPPEGGTPTGGTPTGGTPTGGTPTGGTPTGSILQEYADNRGIALKVNREQSTIAGVKLLGTVSAKGREYPPAVIGRAIPLYEGRAVNVDHVEPNARRSYRDRIGCLRDVQLKADGLYGTLHFNPKHVLAEQLIWDAENAPQNVGFSHDARGPSKLQGGRMVVESIDKVLSVDLVANPATTSGLFEDAFVEGLIAEKIAADGERSEFCQLCCSAMDMIRTAMYDTDAALPAVTKRVLSVIADWQKEIENPTASADAGDSSTQESTDMAIDYKDISLADLRKERPDLLTALQEDLAQGEAAKQAADEHQAMQEELTSLRAEKQARVLQETIDGELKAAKLDPADKVFCSDVFLGTLRAAPDAAGRKLLVEDRVKTLAEARTRTANVGPVTAGAAAAGGRGVPTDPVEFRRSLLGG